MSVWKLFGAIGPPRSEVKTYGLGACSRCRRRNARCSSLNRVNARRPSFAAPNVQAPGIQLDLMPLQIADLGSSQTVPDHLTKDVLPLAPRRR